MKKLILALILGSSLVLPHWAAGAVPQSISYQGKLVVTGTNYQGTAYFKFAIVNPLGNVTYWSNDGSSSGGQLPTAGIELTVINGLFAVGLGDTRIVNMIPVPSSAFANVDTQLRVWFDTQPNSGYQLLSPDQLLRSVPYAHLAAFAQNVASGSVGIPELANGAVTEPKLGTGAVSTRTIQPNAVSGIQIIDGTITAADLDSDPASLARVSGGYMFMNGGNVGIGTATATSLLDLWGGSRSLLDLVMTGGDTSTPVFQIFRDNPKSDATRTLSVDRAGTLRVADTVVANGFRFPSGAEFQSSEGGSLELGPSVGNGAGPFIDFHYGVGTNQDYNVRLRNDGNRRLSLLANGGVDVTLRVLGAVVADAFTPTSDRNKKTNIVELNHRASLATILELPVYSWSFTNSPAEIHEGPMAQDWFKLTGLGADDTHINLGDLAGKITSAIKGLHELVQEKDARITSLERQMDELTKQMTNMQDTVTLLVKSQAKNLIQQATFRPETAR